MNYQDMWMRLKQALVLSAQENQRDAEEYDASPVDPYDEHREGVISEMMALAHDQMAWVEYMTAMQEGRA